MAEHKEQITREQAAAKCGHRSLRAPCSLRDDFNDAVQAHAGKLGELKPFDSDLRVSFDENFLHGRHLENCQEAISEHLRPLGNLDSHIAIILSGVKSFPSGGQSVLSFTVSQQDGGVPYGIRDMGLSKRNSLV